MSDLSEQFVSEARDLIQAEPDSLDEHDASALIEGHLRLDENGRKPFLLQLARQVAGFLHIREQFDDSPRPGPKLGVEVVGYQTGQLSKTLNSRLGCLEAGSDQYQHGWKSRGLAV